MPTAQIRIPFAGMHAPVLADRAGAHFKFFDLDANAKHDIPDKAWFEVCSSIWVVERIRLACELKIHQNDL